MWHGSSVLSLISYSYVSTCWLCSTRPVTGQVVLGCTGHTMMWAARSLTQPCGGVKRNAVRFSGLHVRFWNVQSGFSVENLARSVQFSSLFQKSAVHLMLRHGATSVSDSESAHTCFDQASRCSEEFLTLDWGCPLNLLRVCLTVLYIFISFPFLFAIHSPGHPCCQRWLTTLHGGHTFQSMSARICNIFGKRLMCPSPHNTLWPNTTRL